MVIFKLPVICYVQIEYAQIIKIRGSVSLQTTATSESSLEPCNTKRVSVSLWVQLLITWFPAGERKYSFSLEVIIKEVGLDRIPEPNYSAYCFTVSIKWFLYSLSSRSSCQLLLCGILCSKPVMWKLVKEVPRFCFVMFLIKSTLYVSLINSNSFIVIELFQIMNLISAEIHFFMIFFGFKHLIKARPSINHEASSGKIVCNASDSLIMLF